MMAIMATAAGSMRQWILFVPPLNQPPQLPHLIGRLEYWRPDFLEFFEILSAKLIRTDTTQKKSHPTFKTLNIH